MRLLTAIQAFIAAWKNPSACKKEKGGSCHAESSSSKTEAPGSSSAEHAHLRLLANLQETARLIDFFKEDIADCSDAQIGAAVRKIHDDCRKKLEELVTIRPIFEEREGSKIQIPAGYDPSTIKLVGNVRQQPPFEGTLIHKGWKAHKKSLPKRDYSLNSSSEILQPAEVQIE